MALAAILILWLGRGTLFWGDELAILIASPHFSLSDALQPHEGHLILTSRVVYQVLFEVFGTSYLPFRLLTVATVLLTVGLFFVYASRRLPALVALAPCLVLLLFGSDSQHVIFGNGFIVLTAVVCGLGALLALERDDRRGDVAACVLLCLGVASYSVALAFVVGIAVVILLDDERVRRIWVVAIPALLYLAWWLWAQGAAGGNGESNASISHALLFPSWGFQSLSAVLGALSGFGYRFDPTASPPPVGLPLAALALVAFGWRLSQRPFPRTLWAALAIVLALWMLEVLVYDPGWRRPYDPRYLFPMTVTVLVLASEAAAGMRWSRAGIYGLYAVVLGGLAVNATLLREQAAEFRNVSAVQTRAAFTGLELAGSNALDYFYPRPLDGVKLPLVNEQSPISVPISALPEGRSVAEEYRAVSERDGGLGYSVAELRTHGEPAGAEADAVLVGALDPKLVPAASPASGVTCRRSGSAGASIPLPRGGALLEADGDATEVQVRRFGATTFGVGTLEPGQPSILRIPADRSLAPWWVYAPTAPLKVCALE
ncbi:MAG TPA: hypothetical protein VG898_11605 [Solirubrobacterales bacterium]|nr:hypothetical protein [Solirubrobacterales bacterium]